MSFAAPVNAVHARETFKEKVIRKFKEEPLVPIGTLATCATLTMAIIKSRRKEARSMNHWLRARIIAQGFTLAAVVAGSYAYGRTQQQQEAKARTEQERLLSSASKERREFEERLKEAEEAHEREEAMKKGTWWGTRKAEVVEVADKGIEVKYLGSSKDASGSGWWGLVGYGWAWGGKGGSKPS